MRWQPAVVGILAAAGGLVTAGPAGLLAGLVGVLIHVAPLRWRILGVLPLAFVPIRGLAGPMDWLVAVLLFAALVIAGLDVLRRPSREAWAAVLAVAVLVPLAVAAVPRLQAFFEADAGLAVFLAGGAAILSLGIAVALSPRPPNDADGTPP